MRIIGASINNVTNINKLNSWFKQLFSKTEYVFYDNLSSLMIDKINFVNNKAIGNVNYILVNVFIAFLTVNKKEVNYEFIN